MVVLTVALAILWLGLKVAGRARDIGRHWVVIRRGTGGGLAAAVALSSAMVPQPVVSVPVSEVIAPGVAIAVLQRILRTRSLQARPANGRVPVRLDDADRETLGRLLAIAGDPGNWGSGDIRRIADVLPADVHRLLENVESTHSAETSRPLPTAWHLMVRIVGEPVVENVHGLRASFGKKRAMELLCWMALNRDRSTRSGARNAMWDLSITDSTFTTIVSDLRRTLGRLTPELPSGYWSPATFTDTLPLGEGLMTDLDVMALALDSGDLAEMVSALKLVRDVPFAGANYLWADLDGSTTRAIITVMDLVAATIEKGTEAGNHAAVIDAARAGLRVMPGDEGLLRVLSRLRKNEGG